MKRQLMPWLLLAPFLLLIAVFFTGIINGFLQSLGVIPALGLTVPTLRYYGEVFGNPETWRSLLYSLWIAAVSSVGSVVLGLALCYGALALKKSRGAFVGMMKLPVLVPHLLVAVFVISLFSGTGLISRLLYAAGLLQTPESFPKLLFDENGVGVILAYLWKQTPFVCYFVMAVMGSISDTLEEAARGLGASRLRAFWSVTLPLSKGAVKNAFYIIFAFSFGAYELPFLLGATLPKALPVQAYVAYTHPDLQHRPYAMVLNMVLVLFCLFFCLLYYKKTGKRGKAR